MAQTWTVDRHLRKPLAWLALLAWLAASGLSWDLLQVVAWTRMSIGNASRLPASAALAKTMSDAPCELCKAARAARRQSEQSPLAKQEAVKEKTKSDSAPLPLLLASVDKSFGQRFSRPVNEAADSLASEVPVPPPRSFA